MNAINLVLAAEFHDFRYSTLGIARAVNGSYKIVAVLGKSV